MQIMCQTRLKPFILLAQIQATSYDLAHLTGRRLKACSCDSDGRRSAAFVTLSGHDLVVEGAEALNGAEASVTALIRKLKVLNDSPFQAMPMHQND